MLLREPLGFCVHVTWSGWEMGAERLSLSSLDRGLKTFQLVIHHQAPGVEKASSPTIKRVPLLTVVQQLGVRPGEWADDKRALAGHRSQMDKWKELSEKGLPSRTVGIFQWCFWCLYCWQLLPLDCRTHWFWGASWFYRYWRMGKIAPCRLYLMK